METKFVYMFKEGTLAMRNLLGGKGATLADMTHLGLPIPQGFIVTTESCNQYYRDNQVLSDDLKHQIHEAMKALEAIAGKRFGDPVNPLLVSVRSGARVSMPGMMDTVLNLGLNDVTVEGLARLSGNQAFAYDSYRRFIQMYSDVVMGIDRSIFEDILERRKHKSHVDLDSELSAEDLKVIITQFKMVYEEHIGEIFPQDPKVQLETSIAAVFQSWMNPRAHTYRKMHGYHSDWGTAVNVQMMVFGNLGETSGSGVAFSRSPVDGSKGVFGEYLLNVQGEDVVAGIRTPDPISTLKKKMPDMYNQFEAISQSLETHYKDMQDMEFTIEKGTLYILQARSGKRTAAAALKIAVDMVDEGLLSIEEALLQINAGQLDQLLHPHFNEASLKDAYKIGQGLPASPGAASGHIVFCNESAQHMASQGKDVILVRTETSPEDIEGMQVAKGILTARGGMTSHAAVVARGMGIACVSGCGELLFSQDVFELGGLTYQEGDVISIDGSTGLIYDGAIVRNEATMSDDFKTLMSWVTPYDKLKVRANADSAEDAERAFDFGATGIGLTRTEHMFFEAERILAMRQMILADTLSDRQDALDLLLPIQRDDFKSMFLILDDKPMTIRLLDPPLHEFLPQSDADIAHLAKQLNQDVLSVKQRIQALHEFNPMMGHRGVRLAVSYPEIAKMQTRAIIEAAIEVQTLLDVTLHPEIMIPLIGDHKEFEYVKAIVEQEAQRIIEQMQVRVAYSIGSMIEVPRATLIADQIAHVCDFFSFGTNDLTQLTYGFSRDDAAGFLEHYYDEGIYTKDPFRSVDEEGVGQLIEMAIRKARVVKPEMLIGVCGEHGGDPTSISYFYSLGMDYVSCSPYRVPIARLAAAQAQINQQNKERKF